MTIYRALLTPERRIFFLKELIVGQYALSGVSVTITKNIDVIVPVKVSIDPKGNFVGDVSDYYQCSVDNMIMDRNINFYDGN